MLGRLYIGHGRVADGIATLNKAIEANAEEPRAYLHLGRAYLDQGEAEKAVAPIERAIELRPSLFQAKLQLAKVHQARQDYTSARAVLVGLAQGRRALHSVHRLLGDLALDEGQYAQAIEEYQASLLHAAKLVEEHPELTELTELTELADRQGDDQALATAYRAAFAKITSTADDEDPAAEG